MTFQHDEDKFGAPLLRFHSPHNRVFEAQLQRGAHEVNHWVLEYRK